MVNAFPVRVTSTWVDAGFVEAELAVGAAEAGPVEELSFVVAALVWVEFGRGLAPVDVGCGGVLGNCGR